MSYHYLMPGPWLAQGSAPPSGTRVPFDVIVLAAMEYQEAELPGYVVIRVPFDNSGPPPSSLDRRLIRRTAREIADRVRFGERVLVTCRLGWTEKSLLQNYPTLRLSDLRAARLYATRHTAEIDREIEENKNA